MPYKKSKRGSKKLSKKHQIYCKIILNKFIVRFYNIHVNIIEEFINNKLIINSYESKYDYQKK